MRTFESNLSIARDTQKHQEKAGNSRPKSILEAFECIVELAENSNLDNDFFDKATVHIKYATRRLKMTPIQAVLLAIFIDRGNEFNTMSEIARYLGCRTTRMMRLSNEIKQLESRHYVRISKSRKSVQSFRVPEEVLDSLRDNKPYVYTQEPVAGTQEFFDRFDKLMDEKRDNELTYDQLFQHTTDLLKSIIDTMFVRELKRYNLLWDDCVDDEMLLFIFMAHLYVENNDDSIRFSDIKSIYDDEEIPPHIKHNMRLRRSSLFYHELIENANEDGMARSDAFKLTDKAKSELLGELRSDKIGKSDKDLIKADSLTEKVLVYNPTEQTQISELSSLLSHDRFADVQSRLLSAGMRKGFCCLFYGSPGTGKTETVYQLARQTGRNIMQVDVDKVKSCWVGESEKNIKSLFDRYRAICQNVELAPILLFNEADAVLGVRMEGASKAVDKMENSIQNIILQEMENLDGIMIATTNLTTNLDKAFERRFLYKVCFEKPSSAARAQIWHGMISGLSEEQALLLAEKFNLSGGEIENIARKHIVMAILTGDDTVDLDKIIETCEQERISQRKNRRIGF